MDQLLFRTSEGLRSPRPFPVTLALSVQVGLFAWLLKKFRTNFDEISGRVKGCPRTAWLDFVAIWLTIQIREFFKGVMFSGCPYEVLQTVMQRFNHAAIALWLLWRNSWSPCTALHVQPAPKWVWIPVFLRVLFIPFFMLCNVKPATRSMPVLFGDYVYCAGSILMAFTNGYFSSVVMMYAPRYVRPFSRS